MFSSLQRSVLVGGGSADDVIVQELLVVEFRASRYGAGNCAWVLLAYVAGESVESAFRLLRNVFRNPEANPSDDGEVIPGWLVLLFSRIMRKRTWVPLHLAKASSALPAPWPLTPNVSGSRMIQFACSGSRRRINPSTSGWVLFRLFVVGGSCAWPMSFVYAVSSWSVVGTAD